MMNATCFGIEPHCIALARIHFAAPDAADEMPWAADASILSENDGNLLPNPMTNDPWKPARRTQSRTPKQSSSRFCHPEPKPPSRTFLGQHVRVIIANLGQRTKNWCMPTNRKPDAPVALDEEQLEVLSWSYRKDFGFFEYGMQNLYLDITFELSSKFRSEIHFLNLPQR
jgi:hypothetical protein